MKYKNTEDIRIALGLLPWDKVKLQAIKDILESKHLDNQSKAHAMFLGRRQGKTTKMLIEAVYQSQFKPVAIAGWCPKYTQILVNDARDMCQKLGLSPENIVYPIRTVTTFQDHYRP